MNDDNSGKEIYAPSLSFSLSAVISTCFHRESILAMRARQTDNWEGRETRGKPDPVAVSVVSQSIRTNLI